MRTMANGQLRPKRLNGALHAIRWVAGRALRRIWIAITIFCISWYWGDQIAAATMAAMAFLVELAIAHWVALVTVAFGAILALLIWIALSSARDAIQIRHPGDHILEIADQLFPPDIRELVANMVSDMKIEYSIAVANNSRIEVFWITFRYRLGILLGLLMWITLELCDYAMRVIIRRSPPSV